MPYQNNNQDDEARDYIAILVKLRKKSIQIARELVEAYRGERLSMGERMFLRQYYKGAEDIIKNSVDVFDHDDPILRAVAIYLCEREGRTFDQEMKDWLRGHNPNYQLKDNW